MSDKDSGRRRLGKKRFLSDIIRTRRKVLDVIVPDSLYNLFFATQCVTKTVRRVRPYCTSMRMSMNRIMIKFIKLPLQDEDEVEFVPR